MLEDSKVNKQDDSEIKALKNKTVWLTSLYIGLFLGTLCLLSQVSMLSEFYCFLIYLSKSFIYLLFLLHLFFSLRAINQTKMTAGLIVLLAFFLPFLIVICPIVDLIWLFKQPSRGKEFFLRMLCVLSPYFFGIVLFFLKNC